MMECKRAIVDHREDLCPRCKELPPIGTLPIRPYQIHESFEDFVACSCHFCKWLYACYSQHYSSPPETEAGVKRSIRLERNVNNHLSLQVEIQEIWAARSVTLWSFAHPADPISSTIKGRDPPCDPSSSQVFTTIQTWLSACSEKHASSCYVSDERLPTYLIEVGSDGDTELCHLVKTSESKIDRYITLSYVWGVRQQPLELTRDTKSGMLKKILEQRLPQTIRDAIFVTRKLGVRYLWVDALCIVQDDKQQKKREIAEMQHIYGNSFLTIQAACAESVHEGFLKVRDPQIIPDQRLRYGEPDQGLVYFRVDKKPPSMFEGPTATRAWCYEESVLPPRVLVYTQGQLIFKCRKGTQYEDGRPRYGHSLSPSLFGEGLLPPMAGKIQTRDRREEALEQWYSALSKEYTTRQLTSPHDRLPAILGIAKKIQEHIGGSYLAGIWESDMIRGLLWRSSKGIFSSLSDSLREQQSLKFDPTALSRNGPQIPSWSWAAVNGPINNNVSTAGENMVPVAKIQYYPVSEDSNQSGYLEDCKLAIAAPVRNVYLLSAANVNENIRRERCIYLTEKVLITAPNTDSFIGTGLFDYRNADPSCIWCILLTKGYGLLIEPVDIKSRLYRRVGTFVAFDDKVTDWLREEYRTEVLIV